MPFTSLGAWLCGTMTSYEMRLGKEVGGGKHVISRSPACSEFVGPCSPLSLCQGGSCLSPALALHGLTVRPWTKAACALGSVEGGLTVL